MRTLFNILWAAVLGGGIPAICLLLTPTPVDYMLAPVLTGSYLLLGMITVFTASYLMTKWRTRSSVRPADSYELHKLPEIYYPEGAYQVVKREAFKSQYDILPFKNGWKSTDLSVSGDIKDTASKYTGTPTYSGTIYTDEATAKKIFAEFIDKMAEENKRVKSLTREPVMIERFVLPS